MIKSKRLAYDGRGNAVAKSEEDLSSAVTGKVFVSDDANAQRLGVLYNLVSQFSVKPCSTIIVFSGCY